MQVLKIRIFSIKHKSSIELSLGDLSQVRQVETGTQEIQFEVLIKV